MINITIKRKLGYYELNATGHAGYGEYGKDIVCCAVSILIQTFAEQLQRYAERNMCTILESKLDEGDGAIRLYLYDEAVKISADTIETGLIMIADEYPMFVRVSYEK